MSRSEARSAGVRSTQPRRSCRLLDGAEQISINAVLEHLKPLVESSLWLELSIALADKGGWSMRHYIAHGLVDADYFDASKVACVLHLYLMIGTLKVAPVTAANPSETTPTSGEPTE